MTLPPDVRVRALEAEDEADLTAAFRIHRAYEVAVTGESELTPEAVRSTLTGPDAWRSEHRLALRGDEAVGVLLAEVDRLGREVFADAYALGPRATDIQRTLLAGAVEATRAVAAVDLSTTVPDDPYALNPDVWQVVSACYEQDTGCAEALDSLGFRTIRRFWRMRRDLVDIPEGEPVAPSGVTRRVVDGDADRRIMHALFRDSFAEHFGSTHDHEYEEWIARVEALDGVDPSRWWIATLDGVDVGICLLDDSRAASGDSYVRTLGVVAPARGRGIARWLLECAAADAAARGLTGMALAVDGENVTGATRLYESVGFTVQRTIDVWCYPIIETAG